MTVFFVYWSGPGGHLRERVMEIARVVVFDFFLMFLAAKLAGELFDRLGQPPVIGELLVGIIIGPFGLAWIGAPTDAMVSAFRDAAMAREVLNAVLESLSELGVIVLLFAVGLETRLADLLRVGGRAGAVAALGVLFPFGLGYGLAIMIGQPPAVAAFLGSALVATSVGITARVLADLQALNSVPARIILGAAVIDDILGLIILAIVVGYAGGSSPSPVDVALIAVQAVGFSIFVAFAGRHAVRRWSVHLDRLRIRHAPFVVAMTLMLGLASLASRVGLAAIIGAFLAGMVFAELRESHDLERETRPLYELLVPIFFVITGSRVDWRLLTDPTVLGIALLVTLLAVLGKFVGCGLGSAGLGWRSATIVGVGMAPRGEVGLIVANVGKSAGVVNGPMFSTVVLMSVLTTLVVPPILAWLHRGVSRPSAEPGAVEEEAFDLPDF